MPVRSKRLTDGIVLTPGSVATVYTAPSGETVIIKRVSLVNLQNLPARLAIAIDPAGAAPGASVYESDVSQSQSQDLDVWWVLQPGDSVIMSWAGLTGNLEAMLFGAELEGVAD